MIETAKEIGSGIETGTEIEIEKGNVSVNATGPNQNLPRAAAEIDPNQKRKSRRNQKNIDTAAVAAEVHREVRIVHAAAQEAGKVKVEITILENQNLDPNPSARRELPARKPHPDRPQHPHQLCQHRLLNP